MNDAVFGKTMENVRDRDKALRYSTYYNRKKNELFSIRTKLSYYKVFHKKGVSNRNEKS